MNYIPLNQALGKRTALTQEPVRSVPEASSDTASNARGRINSEAAAARVHVVGCPRSGTTLMAELLQHAYSFHGIPFNEQSLFEPVTDASYPYLSRKPADTHRIEQLLKADSQLYVIAVVRDPRAVITSRDEASKPAEYCVGFEQWRQAMEAITQVSAYPRCIQVHYEALIKDPAGVQCQLEQQISFLQRKKSFDSFADKAAGTDGDSFAALNGARNFDQDQIDSWHDHTLRIRQELIKHPDLAQWLITAGYEADNGWTGLLARLVPFGLTSKKGAIRRPRPFFAQLALRQTRDEPQS